MFDNISQAFFITGATGYGIVVPIMRLLATIFMVISTYSILKSRRDKHIIIWLFLICVSPIWWRVIYEIYRRWISKKTDFLTGKVIKSSKASKVLFFMSIVTFIISAVLFAISVFGMGIGFFKSYADNEPIAVVYDVHGNEYSDCYEVPLHDREGNTYTYEPDWFVVGDYTDQNGNVFDGDLCYLDRDGYFYYDKSNKLTPYKDYDGYYTDGNNIYYGLWGYVYWDEDGTLYDKSGKYSNELFDFE